VADSFRRDHRRTPADVPDNRPLSGGSVGECDLTMMLPSRAMLYIRTLASRIKAA
jgi:hypothetical protein